MKATVTYHSIDDSASPISVSAEAFQDHVRWLTSGTVRVLSLDALARHPSDGDDAVSVTFDDGFLNVRGAVEQLLDNGITPTIFGVTGHVGKTNAWGGRDQAGIPTLPLLGWSDLERLAARGAGIEAHSRTHPSLTRVSVARMDDELGGSQEDLRTRLSVRSAHVAYPYGDVDHVVAERAASLFSFGHTTDLNVMSDAPPPMRLPRLDMYYFQFARALDGWGTPGFTRRLAWLRLRRRIRAAVHP